MTAIRTAASEIAKRKKNRLTTALPAAAEQEAEQHASDEDHHGGAERALLHFLEHRLGRALGFGPAALRGLTDAVGGLGAAALRRVLQDFGDPREVGAQVFQ